MRAVALIALGLALLGQAAHGRELAQAPAPSTAPKIGPNSNTTYNNAVLVPGDSRVPSQTNIGWTDLDGQQVVDLLKKDPKALLIDVRTPEEFQAAHIPGSLNIIDLYRNYTSTRVNVFNENFVKELERAVPDKSTPIIFTCWGGGNSRAAASLAVAAGYKNVYNNYYGFNNHVFWGNRFVETPDSPTKDLKGANPALETYLVAFPSNAVAGQLAEPLGIWPNNRIPKEVTTLIPSDQFLARWVYFGAPQNGSYDTWQDFVDYIKKNETALGQLRASLVYGTIPKKLTTADFKKIGSTATETAFPGNTLSFAASGTRVVTPAYDYINIIGSTDGLPYSYLTDFPTLPVPNAKEVFTWADVTQVVNQVPSISKEEGRKLIDAAIAKAKGSA